MSILCIILMVVGGILLLGGGAVAYLAWYIWKMGQFEYHPLKPKANEGS